jgi:hypothetical protein
MPTWVWILIGVDFLLVLLFMLWRDAEKRVKAYKLRDRAQFERPWWRN